MIVSCPSSHESKTPGMAAKGRRRRQAAGKRHGEGTAARHLLVWDDWGKAPRRVNKTAPASTPPSYDQRGASHRLNPEHFYLQRVRLETLTSLLTACTTQQPIHHARRGMYTCIAPPEPCIRAPRRLAAPAALNPFRPARLLRPSGRGHSQTRPLLTWPSTDLPPSHRPSWNPAGQQRLGAVRERAAACDSSLGLRELTR